MTKKSWSGRFSKKENTLMEEFNASIFVDKRLVREDLLGSQAHARMLQKIGVLTKTEYEKIVCGLSAILKEIKNNKFTFDVSQEDIHMAIESRLAKKIGSLAGKLHTARSRNDQVALDETLYVRKVTQDTLEKIQKLKKIFVELAEKNLDVISPGYTHLQRAQPILLSHHLMAYFEMLTRDESRFADNLSRLQQCPLGAGALAGSPIKIDRQMTAKSLNFKEPTRNSLDTVSNRDFILDYHYAASVLMMHLSRLAEELVLWNSQEFSFVILPEEFCTGSSMMPQKVNPDAPELIRGKVGRVYGNLIALLTTMKALPLAYNKDMQEDKESFFDTVDTLHQCLEILIAMLPKTKFHKENMLEATKKGFVLATDLADYLVGKKLPFRQAHEVVGKLVQKAISENCGLEDFDLATLKKFSKCFEKGVFQVLDVKNSVNARSSYGGTALTEVKRQIKRAKKLMKM